MQKKILIPFLLLLIISSVSATQYCSFINITQGIQGVQGIQGIPGLMNQTINLTINMTAGSTPIKGIDYFDGVDNMTANMTAGTKGDKGDKGDTGEIPDSSQFLFLNGTRAMIGLFNAGGFNLTNLLNPVVPQDAATKAYCDALPIINSSYTTLTDIAAINASMRLNVSINYPELVNGKIPPTELGGAGADNTKYLRGDQSWQVPSGGSGGNGYTIHVLSLSQATVTDAAIYVFGGAPKTPTVTTLGLNKQYYPKAGTIKSAELFGYSTTAGTAEAWPCYLVNSTHSGFSNLIQTVSVSSTTRRWTNTSMNIPAPAEDYFEVRCNSPTWATNPAALIWSGNVYIE